MRGTRKAVAAVLAAACTAACETAAPEPSPPPEPPPEPVVRFDVFSADRAWADLSALAALGPRPAGSESAARARAQIAEELRAVSGDVREVQTVRLRGDASLPPAPPAEPEGESSDGDSEVALDAEAVPRHEILTHVTATLPGASPDLFVLVAPYDSSEIAGIPFVGVNDGASGAALLLELTRVLSTRALPYTVRVIFLEGEGRAPGVLDGERWSGSRGLAEQMEERGELARVRLLLALNQVCDADLQVSRDLGSHRMHREEFFKAARRLGLSDEFRQDQNFETVSASHDAFRERGVRGVVALLDTRFGGDQVPGLYADSLDDGLDHCAPHSLGAVGNVTLAALQTIGARLAKIDRFSRAPLAPVESGERLSGGSPDVIPPELPEPAEADATAPPSPAEDDR